MERECPPLDTFAYHLSRLEKTSQIMCFLHENPIFLSDVVMPGYEELICEYNRLSWSHVDMAILPHVQQLKYRLGSYPLPDLHVLRGIHIIGGIRSAADAMDLGQKIKFGIQPNTPYYTERAVATASMDTHPKALAVGVAGHFISRVFMEYFFDEGMGDWKKDDILHPLDDIALLMHARSLHGKGRDAILYPFITNPNSLGEDGGLRWISPKQQERFDRRYCELHHI